MFQILLAESDSVKQILLCSLYRRCEIKDLFIKYNTVVVKHRVICPPGAAPWNATQLTVVSV